jgi:hypothetical protein
MPRPEYSAGTFTLFQRIATYSTFKRLLSSGFSMESKCTRDGSIGKTLEWITRCATLNRLPPATTQKAIQGFRAARLKACETDLERAVPTTDCCDSHPGSAPRTVTCR